MAYIGGYGFIAHGRSQYGAAASEVEPRFNFVTVPGDNQHNVSIEHVWLTFELYFFSSFIVTEKGPGFDFDFEISENGGGLFTSVYGLTSPYVINFIYKDGQTVWLKVRKTTGDWPSSSKIVIRVTVCDEFNQAVTKTYPVRWENPTSFPYGPGVV